MVKQKETNKEPRSLEKRTNTLTQLEKIKALKMPSRRSRHEGPA